MFMYFVSSCCIFELSKKNTEDQDDTFKGNLQSLQGWVGWSCAALSKAWFKILNHSCLELRVVSWVQFITSNSFQKCPAFTILQSGQDIIRHYKIE